MVFSGLSVFLVVFSGLSLLLVVFSGLSVFMVVFSGFWWCLVDCWCFCVFFGGV